MITHEDTYNHSVCIGCGSELRVGMGRYNTHDGQVCIHCYSSPQLNARPRKNERTRRRCSEHGEDVGVFITRELNEPTYGVSWKK